MKQYVLKYQMLNDVVFTTSNVVLHRIKKGEKGGKVVVLGNGNSLNVNEKGRIVKVDPLMALPDVYYFDPTTTVYAFYYTFECKGLRAAAKDVADFINASLPSNKLILAGHSKAGVCVYDMSKNFIKSIMHTLITISAPFFGTIMTLPEEFKALDKKYNLFLNMVHDCIYSDHNVDKDIAINSSYLTELMADKTPLNAYHINVITRLMSRENCVSFQDNFCYFLEWATGLESDGIVALKSQITRCDREIFMDVPHESSFRRGMIAAKPIVLF